LDRPENKCGSAGDAGRDSSTSDNNWKEGKELDWSRVEKRGFVKRSRVEWRGKGHEVEEEWE